MPSLRSALRIFPRRAGYPDVQICPLTPPEPLALLQAVAADSVPAALASLPQDLREQNRRHVVMLRGRRRMFLLENGNLRKIFLVAIGMPSWKIPTGRFEMLQKIPNP